MGLCLGYLIGGTHSSHLPTWFLSSKCTYVFQQAHEQFENYVCAVGNLQMKHTGRAMPTMYWAGQWFSTWDVISHLRPVCGRYPDYCHRSQQPNLFPTNKQECHTWLMGLELHWLNGWVRSGQAVLLTARCPHKPPYHPQPPAAFPVHRSVPPQDDYKVGSHVERFGDLSVDMCS